MSKRSDVEETPGRDHEHSTGWGGKEESKPAKDRGDAVPTIGGRGEHNSGWTEPAAPTRRRSDDEIQTDRKGTEGPAPQVSARGYSSDASDVPGRPRRIRDGIKRLS